MGKKKIKNKSANQDAGGQVELIWQRAAYHLHTFAYRDPRSVFASGSALPVVSPTTVLLGIVSTLFCLGDDEHARQFLSVAHQCEVMIDAPDGIIFFRAFHQLRRYETLKYDRANPRFGLTNINQGTREYGLVDGTVTLYVGVPRELSESASLALSNLGHLGTHDSMCALLSSVEECSKPQPNEVLYLPSKEVAQKLGEQVLAALSSGITIVTLSQFKKDAVIQPTLPHWHLVGGRDTELTAYAIPGHIQGTTKGKIYRKRR
jgi:hypothetical protein